MGAEDISDSVAGIRAEVVNAVIDPFVPPESVEEDWDLAGAAEAIEREFQVRIDPKAWLEENHELAAAGLRERVVEAVERGLPAEGASRSARPSCATSRRP